MLYSAIHKLVCHECFVCQNVQTKICCTNGDTKTNFCIPTYVSGVVLFEHKKAPHTFRKCTKGPGKSLEQNQRVVLWSNIKGYFWFKKPHQLWNSFFLKRRCATLPLSSDFPGATVIIIWKYMYYLHYCQGITNKTCSIMFCQIWKFSHSETKNVVLKTQPSNMLTSYALSWD